MNAVVTGAGTGIGRAIALRLAADGHSLGLLARNVDALDATAESARKAGAPTVHTAACDIRDRAAVDRTMGALSDAMGGLNCLVANSGVGGPNADGPNDRFDDLVQTNLMGTYYCARAAQRHFSTGEHPRHIVAIAVS